MTWIRCKDRMPIRNQCVWVTAQNGHEKPERLVCPSCYFYAEYGWKTDLQDVRIRNHLIIAWMPYATPKPYLGEP